MAVPVAPNNAPPIFGLSGVQHQRIKAFAGVTYIPPYFTPVPVAAVLQGATIGTAYSETISAQNGTSPYTFSVISGSLPAGLSLAGSTGIISGTPTTAGTSSFTVKVTDVNGQIGSQPFSITVGSPSGGGAYVFLA